MKGNQIVWRTLADAALDDRPTWESLAELGAASGVPTSTAHLAVQRMVGCGAVIQNPAGGLATVNVDKVLTTLAATRNLEADALGTTSLRGAQRLMNGRRRFAIGGIEAASAYLARAAPPDPEVRLLYLADVPVEIPDGNDVLLLRMDAAAGRDWMSGRTSRAQTYADLFALPTREAEELRTALHRSVLDAALPVGA